MGNNLKDLRKSAGWTQEEAAEKLGVSKSQWVKLERGERQLTENYITRLAAIFGKAPAEIITGPIEIPLMGYLGAGAVIEPDYEQVPLEGLELIEVPFPVPDEMIAFGVKGDSMFPAYRDRSVILVYREQKKPLEAFYGLDAAVLTSDGRRFIKTIMRGQSGVNLVSFNNPIPIEDVQLEWIGEIFAVLPPAAIRQVARQGGIQGQLRLRA